MSNSLYNSSRAALITGQINWLVDAFKVVPLTASAYTVDLATDQYLSDIPVGARLDVPLPITGRFIVGGAATGDDVTFSTLVSVTVDAVAIFKDTGVEGTSPLIAYLDSSVSLPLAVTSGLAILWDTGPSKIFTIPSGGAVSSVAGRTGIVTLSASDISGLSLVATSGDYNDLINAPATYTPEIASATVLGGVKVGSGLAIDGTGILSADGVKSYNDLTSTPILQTAQGTIADAEAGDPYWSNTVLLLGMDGLASSTTFTDSKGINTFTVGGSAQLSTAQQKFSGNSTAYFNGSSYIASTTSPASYAFGTLAFTIECWIYVSGGAGTPRTIIDKTSSWGNGGIDFRFELNTSQQFGFATNVGGVLTYLSGAAVASNTWTHIAVCSTGSQIRLYVNGVGNTTAAVANVGNVKNEICIGCANNGGRVNYFVGYIDDVRITSGVARYVSDFTPPQSSLLSGQSDPYWANTQLLFHMDGTHNSTSIVEAAKGTAVTVFGGAKLSTVRSKFGPSSAAFTGTTSDYMTVPAAAFGPGTGDFTVECWVYKTGYTGAGVANDETIFGNTNMLFYLNNADGFPRYWDGFTGNGSTISVGLNQWTHVAWVRASGVFKMFVNGAQGYSGAYATSIPASNAWRIGGNPWSDSTRWFSGWIDELRVSNIARYTANFVPNASQFLSGNSDPQWNNVLSLLHFDGTDGSTSITDTKGITAWTAIGSAVLSSAQKAFGTTSLRTTGSTMDYVRTTSATNAFGLLNSDVATIELWAYPTSAISCSIADNQSFFGSNEKNWNIWYDGGTVSFAVGDSNTGNQQGVVTSSAPLTLNSWNHIAVTKNGTSVTIWINGVSSGTGTISITMGNRSDRYMVIGSYHNVPAQYNFRGYLDEFRFTKNVVRYTVAFTPNASAFPEGMATPGSVQFNRKGSLAGSPLFVWDELNNRLGVGVANPAYELDVAGSIKNTGQFITTSNGNYGFRHTPSDGTSNASMELGAFRTGNGYAYVDLVGDTTYTDFGLRLIRNNAGSNTNSELIHRGTGALYLTAWDAGQLVLRTSNTDRLIVSATAANVGIGGAPVAGHALYSYGATKVKVDQTGNTTSVVENLSSSGNSQAFTGVISNVGFSNLGLTNTAWSVGSGGGYEVLNGGSGYVNTTATKLALIVENAAGVLNILTGGSTNSNIRARWSAAGNLALGYGSTQDAQEKLQIYAGNLKLDGTDGTHGLMFPDSSKQLRAADQYNVKDNTAVPSVMNWRVFINTVPDGIISIAELRFFDMSGSEISSAATYSTVGNSGTWTSYGSLYDGNYSGTFWDFSGATQALKVSFATNRTVKFIRIGPRTGYLARMPTSVTVQYSSDGTNWVNQVTNVPTTGWATDTLKEITVTSADTEIPVNILNISHKVRYDQGLYEVLSSPAGSSLVWTKHFGTGAAGSSIRGDLTVLGTAGIHGLVFPDGSKQIAAVTPAGASASITGDSDWASVVMMLPLATNFVDLKGHTVQASGFASQTTIKKYLSGAVGNLANSGTDCLYWPTGNDQTLVGDFTLETWFYQQQQFHPLFAFNEPGATTHDGSGLYLYTYSVSGVVNTSGLGSFAGSASITQNAWHHIAIVRKSGVTYWFFNGNRIGVVTGWPTSITQTNGRYNKLGNPGAGQANLQGFFSEFRWTSTARYDYNSPTYTVPAAALPQTPATGSPGSVQFNQVGALTGDVLFNWQPLTKQHGVGIATPTELLHMSGGNLKLDGTSGTHGIIFPDGSKQTSAGRTQAEVNSAIQAVVGAAPAALDTLTELAAALGNDANFAGSVTSSLSLKANISSLATVATTGAYADLTGTPTPYVLPIATGAVLGGIKVDGTTIVIDGSGVLSSTSGGSHTDIHNNTFVGVGTLFSNTTGYENTALGRASLYSNTDGNDNTAVGDSALYSMVTGNYNVAIGISAGYDITSGSYNVVIGGNSGLSIDGLSNHIILSDGAGNIRATVDAAGVFNVVGSLTINGIATAGSLPTASATILGGVKVGTGLAIDGSSVLSVAGKANTSYLLAFGNADLSSGILTVLHSLGSSYCVAQVYDDLDKTIIPDEITMVDSNNLTVDLTSFGTLTGTWHIRIVP